MSQQPYIATDKSTACRMIDRYSTGLVRLALCLALTALVGCSPNLPEILSRSSSPSLNNALPKSYGGGDGGYYQDDGPPSENLDVAMIPDAVPQNQPLSKTGNRPYEIFGKQYAPMKSARGFEETGYASWYGKKFHGKRTSSGEPYDMFAMTAAHPTLPLPTWIRVYNHENGRTAVVKVNDRGPFLRSRIVDLSYAAAAKLDIVRKGTSRVTITAVFPGDEETGASTLNHGQDGKPIQYLVQMGAFAEHANAKRMRARLASLGFKIYPESPSEVSISNGLYVVSIGPFDSRAQAELAAKSLIAKIGKKGIVLRRPQ